MAKSKSVFTAAQRATLKAAGEILIDVADAQFKRGMRKVAKAAGSAAKQGLRKGVAL